MYDFSEKEKSATWRGGCYLVNFFYNKYMYHFWPKNVSVNSYYIKNILIVNVTRVCNFQLNQMYSVKLNKELNNNESIFCYNNKE